MLENIKRYKDDLKKLISKGESLNNSMYYECFPEKFKNELKEAKVEPKDFIKGLPIFRTDYESWYSEAKMLIKQLLPQRLDDFVRYYEKQKSRKSITFENYQMVDYLQGLIVSSGGEKIVGKEAAINKFSQQCAILHAVSARFESSLFDIRQLVQADIFDSELSAAQELLNKGFVRASGAVAAVVLEKHLSQVVENHNISTRKKNYTISEFNDLLKKEDLLDTPSWRQIQRLSDIRNLCDHDKRREPTKEEAQELISGVEKYTKTLF